MISDNRDRIGGSLQIMFPFRESKDNSKKFPIIDIIVTFCWQEDFEEVDTRVKIPIGVLLHEYSTSSKKRSIRHKVKWLRYIWDGKDRGRCKNVLQSVKCTLLEGAPGPGLVLSCEGSEGGDNVRVIGNELPVEVSKA